MLRTRLLQRPLPITHRHLLLHPRFRCTAPSVSSAAAAAEPAATATAAKPMAAAGSAARAPPDDRPFLIRHKWMILISSVLSTWIYTLVVANRTRKVREEVEDDVRARTPINPDEMLELRAVNDVSTAQLATLPALLAKRGAGATATQQQLLLLLFEAVGAELSDAYVVERMLMAHPPAPDAPAKLETPVAVASLMFLSSGPVAERLAAMHDLLATPDAAAVPVERLTSLLDALRSTGQVPIEQRVETVDEGANPAGVPLNYYTVQPVREFGGADWVSQWMAQGAEGAGGEAGAAATAAARAGGGVDLADFVSLLTSEMVCVWGECNNIREKARLDKQRKEAEEYARNPPAWHFWKWSVFGGGK